MASAAAEERLRLQRLSGAAGWCQLVKELGSEVEAAVGVGCELTRYPAVYVDKIEVHPFFPAPASAPPPRLDPPSDFQSPPRPTL